MRQGDFTSLAKHYSHRIGYSMEVIRAMRGLVGSEGGTGGIADVGAGTGKLAECLLDMGMTVDCVEPNKAMLSEGQTYLSRFGNKVNWSLGSAEATGLRDNNYSWVLMGSSFHWADSSKALTEFHRILCPNGWLSVLWNPRDRDVNQREQAIEAFILRKVPNMKRVSSGSRYAITELEEILTKEGLFSDCVFMEAQHSVQMSKERYIGLWRSVNDVQSQAGPAIFEDIMAFIADLVADQDDIEIKYRTRAWMVRRN